MFCFKHAHIHARTHEHLLRSILLFVFLKHRIRRCFISYVSDRINSTRFYELGYLQSGDELQRSLQNRDARIIVASFYATTAMKVFCEVRCHH